MRKVRINDFLEEVEVCENECTDNDMMEFETRLEELKDFFKEETKEKNRSKYSLGRVFVWLVEIIDILVVFRVCFIKSFNVSIIMGIILLLNIFAGITLSVINSYK